MTEERKPVDLSLILPVYNEEECIEKTLLEAHSVLKQLPGTFEILAVDDGSTDKTASLLKTLSGRLECVRALRLIPNSGQSAAMGVGFRHAKGKVVVLMDADGQIASTHSVDEIRDFVGADSLTFLSIGGVLSALDLPYDRFCFACFDGRYPVPVPYDTARHKFVLEDADGEPVSQGESAAMAASHPQPND